MFLLKFISLVDKLLEEQETARGREETIAQLHRKYTKYPYWYCVSAQMLLRVETVI